jgi:hypothetical protein
MSISPPQTRRISQKIRRLAASLGIQQGPPVHHAMIDELPEWQSRRANVTGGSFLANLSSTLWKEPLKPTVS